VSDIFKKITSIEPDDKAVTSSLGLKPVMDLPKKDVQQPNPEKTPSLLKQDTTEVSDDGKDPLPTFITETPHYHKASPETSYRWIGVTASLAILIWITTAAAIAYGFLDLGLTWRTLKAVQMASIALLIMGPALMIFLTAYAFRQLAKLTAQAAELARVSDALLRPDETATSRVAAMNTLIKDQINQVDARIDIALSRMQSLADTLQNQASLLSTSSQTAEKSSDHIASTLSEQRIALELIAGTFDSRMDILTKTLGHHSEELNKSTQIAEQKIHEARISVEGAAAKINAASEVVRNNSVEAAQSLDSSQNEIETLSQSLLKRSQELDAMYKNHAVNLSAMIEDMQAEQQNLGSSLEERLNKMRDMALSAKVSAESLIHASDAGRDTVSALSDAARLSDNAVKDRFAEMEDLVRYSNEKAEKISDIAARRVQDSLAQTRKEITRIETDMAALQNRLASRTIEPPIILEDKPQKNNKKRRNLLRLKPIDDKISPKPAEPEQPQLNPEVPELRLTPQSETERKFNQALSLDIQDVSSEHDLVATDPDAEIKDFVLPASSIIPKDDIMRRAITDPPQPVKEKSRWRWRDMLSGLERPETPNPLSQPMDDNGLIAALSALGLAPNAIVDDGLIIEAVNARCSKGARAMSHVVTRRLDKPVSHLAKAVENDSHLKSNIHAFTTQYAVSLASIETDRKALRIKLETEIGRAYILCDAALHG